MMSAMEVSHKPERQLAGGALLVAGSLCGVLAMAHHPRGRDLLEAGRFLAMARVNAAVHGAALLGVGAVFLGLLALRRRLAGTDLATAAMVAYGFAAAAVISAAVASGFVATELIGRIAEQGDAAAGLERALLGYTHLLNEAYAKVYVAASSLSLVLWAAAILRTRRLSPAAGVAGAGIGAVVLFSLVAGLLRLDVHGFGLVTFAQSAWLAWVGVLLAGAPEGRPPRSGA